MCIPDRAPRSPALLLSLLLALFAVLAHPQPGRADAACTPEQRSAQRAAETGLQKALRGRARASDRLDAQDRRIGALTAAGADVSALPPRPALPEPPGAPFDDSARLAPDCADTAAAGTALEEAEALLAAFTGALEAAEAEIAARETALLDLESATAPGPEPEPEQAAPAPGAAAQPGPLPVEDNALLFQRVLTLPDARTAPAAGGEPDEAGAPLPPFSVLYVFERAQAGDGEWLAVGPRIDAAPLGWLPAASTLEWNSALVMQFAPKGKRERVLFFENSRDLVDIVTGFRVAQEAGEIYDALAAGTLEDSRLVAVEPATAVSYADEPYLLPVVGHVEQMFDDGTQVNLVKVASVSLRSATLGARDEGSLEAPAPAPEADLAEFRVGIAFVIDTTASMGPYIERTRETVREIYQAFEAAATEARASFGIVAYRDSMAHDAGVEYLTRVIQPLDAAADPRTVLANLAQVGPSRSATVDWREDAYAGLAEAIEGFDWEPFDARMIFLVTDAGAREGADGLASRHDLTTQVLNSAAVQKNIAILPLHLVTPEAMKLGQVESAADQYRRLSVTGDVNSRKYVAVAAETDEAFRREIRAAAASIVEAVVKAAHNQRVDTQAPAVNDGYITSDDPGAGGGEAGPATRLGGLVANEILRAQLEYLGRRDEAVAPGFVSGWAANRDLTDPTREMLEISVFLNRNQVSALAQSVEILVDAFRAADQSPGAFFDELQLVAARTARDPELVRSDERAAVREILPAFMQGLPYLSEVLGLDRALWSSFSAADRERFVEGLEEKLRIYRQLYDQTENWVDFGSGDPALEAYPLALAKLP